MMGLGHKKFSIDDNIKKRLLELEGIPHNSRQVLSQVGYSQDIVQFLLICPQRQGLFNNLVNIYRKFLFGLPARECK